MNQGHKARAICIFSLILYCLDNGSDFFVSVDLFLKCHERYGASVLFFIVLPGIIYGFFKYFKRDPDDRRWRHILQCFIGHPIFFIPISLWKLVKAVLETDMDDDGDSSREEDDAKW